MISKAIQHAKDRKAREARERSLLHRAAKLVAVFRSEDNGSKLKAASSKTDEGTHLKIY
jgi:hypothetical protein